MKRQKVGNLVRAKKGMGLDAYEIYIGEVITVTPSTYRTENDLLVVHFHGRSIQTGYGYYAFRFETIYEMPDKK